MSTQEAIILALANYGEGSERGYSPMSSETLRLRSGLTEYDVDDSVSVLEDRGRLQVLRTAMGILQVELSHYGRQLAYEMALFPHSPDADAKTLAVCLSDLGEGAQRGRIEIDSDRVHELTDWSMGRIEDAARTLLESGLANVRRSIDGFDIELTAQGRLEAAELKTEAPQHFMHRREAPPLRFVPKGKLGAGRQGEVWRAHDVELRRDVALKLIRKEDATRATVVEHARALARVQHPSIVTVHEVALVFDPLNGEPIDAAVMELIEGVTLAERLGAPLSPKEALGIGAAVIGAITAYHSAHLAHRDLHDENVIVGGVVKVLDPLYCDTAALTSTATRDTQQRRDRSALRDILVQLLSAAGLADDLVAAFDRNARIASLAEIRVLFESLLDSSIASCTPATTAAP